MRQIVLTVLFAVLIVSLNRDETWALPDIVDGHVSEADLEEIIDQHRFGPQIVELPACDCGGHPTDELTLFKTLSEEVECDCASQRQVEWICGTMALKAEAAIRKAIEAGLHPWVVAQLVEQNCGLLGTCKFGL